MKDLIINAGGTAEKTIQISDIEVPDCWHSFTYLNNDIAGGYAIEHERGKHHAKAVLECWHLAAAMRDKLQQHECPTLPGRIYLARRENERNKNGIMDNDIVLVHLPNNSCTPFVTWLQTLDNQATMHGHYFETITEAVEDFTDRT